MSTANIESTIKMKNKLHHARKMKEQIPSSLCWIFQYCEVLVAMYILIFFSLVYYDYAESMLWPKGIVHYAINTKDYDLHSQDIIISAFDTLEKELCIKFFNTPPNYSATVEDKILYISNPNKQKNCPTEHYNYTGTVVDMSIGYKCLNKKDVARLTIDMLKASIDQTAAVVNSYDLVKLFEEHEQAQPRSTFLKTEDRNYINAHYHAECSALAARVPSRRAKDEEFPPSELTPDNEQYYEDKLWPLGIVMYSVEDGLRDSPDYKRLVFAMTQIELASCVVFHEVNGSASLAPNSWLLFQGDGGDDFPKLGMQTGEQRLNLGAATHGAPGHAAHTLNCLLRVLGLHMVSNRYDRDNYLTINWQYVKYGHEHLLEKSPREAWVEAIPYDFASATHAPANFLCGDCRPGAHTVVPLQDFLWQRTILMGHKAELSASDRKLLGLLYGKQCKNRFISST